MVRGSAPWRCDGGHLRFGCSRRGDDGGGSPYNGVTIDNKDHVMTAIPPISRKAYEIAAGQALLDADSRLCMKAEQAGKDFVHHFIVPLEPRPEGPLKLVYVDPEEEFRFCGGPVVFDLSEEAPPRGRAAHGDIVRNPQGDFLKLMADPRFQWTEAYMELATGQLRRRQEKKVAAVYSHWRVSGVAGSSPGAWRADDNGEG